MTLAQQIRFITKMRAVWAYFGQPKAVQIATAIIASLHRLQKFEREKR